MPAKTTNNAHGTLAGDINNSVTTINLSSGQGAKFPSLSAGEYFYGTLIAVNNTIEIVKVTARSSDALTVTRAQDNTSASAFSTGDRFELRPTAALFNEFVQKTGDNLVTNFSIDGDLTLTGDSYNVVWDKSANYLRFADNARASFGASDDFTIRHSSTSGDSFLVNITGDLVLTNGANDQDIRLVTDDGSGNASNYFVAHGSSGEARLYHYGTQKLATKSTGIDVTGTVTDDGAIHDGDVTFAGASSNLVWDKSATTLQFPQNSFLKLGDAYLLHQAVAEDLFIVNPATGGHIHLQVKMSNNLVGNCVSALSSTGEVRLHYSDSIKLKTQSTGIDVTGSTTTDTLRVTDDTDVSVSSTGHGFQVGASDSYNIAMDTNEIMARNDGAAGILYLNAEGGAVMIGSGGLVLEDTDHKIEKATSTYGQAIRVSTDSGYTDIGMQNGVYSHFITDSTNGFYFQNGVTMAGNLFFNFNTWIGWEGSTQDGNETFLYATDPTADRSIYLPDESGTLATQTHATGKAIAMSIVFG